MDLTPHYPFDSILINGRTVTIHTIISSTAWPLTEFENHTFSFIREWLTTGTDFSVTTSGSTGHPKSITLTRAQMQSNARMTIEFLGLNKNDTALVCLNTQFIAGRMMLIRAFEAGMYIVAQEPSSNPLLNISSRIDFMAVVPLQFQTIVEGGESSIEQLNKMKAILIGGASVSDSLKKEIKKIKTPVFATYGMTETISHVALQKLNGNFASDNYVLLPGIHIEKDDRGCLIIKASYLSEKIITNDLADITNDREFRWLGRWDNIVNTGGIKIMPEKIEAQISATSKKILNDVNFFIHGVPDDKLGQKLILVIETEKNVDKEKIILTLKELLSRYEVPKEVITIPKFIYTKTGKINRKETLADAR